MKSFNWNIPQWLSKYRRSLQANGILRSYVLVLLKPIEQLHQQLLDLKADFDLRMRYNSQQMAYAAVLNKIFDPIQKRIRVITGSDALPELYTYFHGETATTLYTYFDSEVSTPIYTYFDYENDNDGLIIVFAPLSLQPDEARLRGWIQYYKLADKKYQIIYE